MGRIVVSEFVSLDGVMEAPGGEPGHRHTGWVGRYPGDEWSADKLDEVQHHEALLLGRRTYESFAGAWPDYTGPLAEKLNAMPKYVASTTLTNPEWNNTTVLEGDVAGAVAEVKADLAGDLLVHGSRTLVSTLHRAELIDEYRFLVFPIVLGRGMRLFDETDNAQGLTLVDMARYESGAVLLTYEPDGPGQPGDPTA